MENPAQHNELELSQHTLGQNTLDPFWHPPGGSRWAMFAPQKDAADKTSSRHQAPHVDKE